VLARRVAHVVERPQLGPLRLRVPRPELVADADHALLRARLVLVAPGAAEQRAEAVLLHGVEERHRLQLVAALPGPFAHAAGGQRLGNARDLEPDAELGEPPVAELDDLGEVVPGVDVQHRERHGRRPERLHCEVEQHD
jgi:hypothetical protein